MTELSQGKLAQGELAQGELARKVAAAMFERDLAAQHLGITIKHVDVNSATLAMTVAPHMLNGHESCHGGFIFALADTAFAYACNSRNDATVAAGCSIEYLAPGREGDILVATATETARAGRQGVYDILVTNQDGIAIAAFRGRSASLRKPVIED